MDSLIIPKVKILAIPCLQSDTNALLDFIAGIQLTQSIMSEIDTYQSRHFNNLYVTMVICDLFEQGYISDNLGILDTQQHYSVAL